jgi:hypothetical protein
VTVALCLTKTKAALAEYDIFREHSIAHPDYAHSQEAFDQHMAAWGAKKRAVLEAFYEETKDRNAHDIVEYMVIDEWLRKLVEKYGG